MPIRAVLELLGGQGVFVRRSDQEGAEVAGVVGIGHTDGGSGAKLAHEGTQARHQADQIVGCKGQDGILDGVFRQGGKALGVTSDVLGCLLLQGDTDRVAVVEGDGVAIGEVEGGHISAAVVAADGGLPDAFDTRPGVERAAFRTTGGDIRVSQETPRHEFVVAGGGSQGGDGNVLNAQGDSVAHLRSSNSDRHGDLVPAAQLRGNHRSPAAGSGIGDNMPAVPHRPQHGTLRVEDAVGELVDVNCLVSAICGGFGNGLGLFGRGGNHHKPPCKTLTSRNGYQKGNFFAGKQALSS